MTKARLEAFSDEVIAIVITSMVLEMKVPHGDRLKDLVPLVPTFLSYVLSFIYVCIYWNHRNSAGRAQALCHKVSFCFVIASTRGRWP